MTYHLIDIPSLHELPFESRYVKMQELFPGVGLRGENPLTGRISVIKQTICDDKSGFERYCSEVLANQGEGVMLRKASSLYERGRRTSSMCKWKVVSPSLSLSLPFSLIIMYVSQCLFCIMLASPRY